MLLLHCERKPESPEPKPQKPVPSLIIGDPFSYGVKNSRIFPVGTSYTPKQFDKPDSSLFLVGTSTFTTNMGFATHYNYDRANSWDQYADTLFSNALESDQDIRNLLFYDLVSGESYILTEDTIHILSFAVHREWDKPLILYRIVKEDANLDDKYDSKDPVMLFVSKLNGDSLQQVTPSGEHYLNYTYFSENKSILVKTMVDENENGIFEKTDGTNFVEMRLDSPAYGRSIFPENLKARLREQIQAAVKP